MKIAESRTENELILRIADPEGKGAEKVLEDPFVTEHMLPGTRETIILKADYYDTEEFDLRQHGIVFRTRSENGRYFATVKTSAGKQSEGLHRRKEWNVALPDGYGWTVPPDNDMKRVLLETFKGTDIWLTLNEALSGKRQPVELFRTVISRISMQLLFPVNSRIELSADSGEIISGDKSRHVEVLELELVSGGAEILRIACAELSSRHALIPEESSKYDIGISLYLSSKAAR